MNTLIDLGRRAAVSALALSGTTELVTARVGVAAFLPRLFATRYTTMGGLDPERFAAHLGAVDSFHDQTWCGYWNALAAEHLSEADRLLAELTGPDGVTDVEPTPLSAVAAPDAGAPGDPENAGPSGGDARWAGLRALLAPAAAVIADHGPQPDRRMIEALTARPEYTEARAAVGAEHLTTAVAALDQWIKAITYFQVSAFPGHTPARTQAYWASRRHSDALMATMAAGLDDRLEQVDIDAGGEQVHGYLLLPPGPGPYPAVLMTNGLEGTVQELALPALGYRHRKIATLIMEMPGSYVYRAPMTPDSTAVYRAVLDHLAADPRLDPERLGMVGVSFGGHWAARMAATEPRLRCAVSCGPPLHHAFTASGSLGQPQVIVDALRAVTGSPDLLTLRRALHELSLAELYEQIRIPLLVINGEHDTLCGTRDSVELATRAPHGLLKLYPDDDHCAMKHLDQWLELTQNWLSEHLAGPAPAPIPTASHMTTGTS